MGIRRFAAVSILSLLVAAVRLLGQADDAAAARRKPIDGPTRVEVKQSANATLEVGGTGAGNPTATGENVRGNLGANAPQPAAAPMSPPTGVPGYSLPLFRIGPDLRVYSSRGGKPTEQEKQAAEELILPRFRKRGGEYARLADPLRSADGWRYRYFNGRWWYWQPNGAWAIWDGREWKLRGASP